jgi:hypothetical protein
VFALNEPSADTKFAWVATSMAATSDSDEATPSHRPLGSTAATDISRYLLLLIFVAGLAHATYYLLLGIASPLLDLFAFRQTQTALSAYWMWRGGPWFAYETPVLGYPWAVPFEFPIYQALVAALRTAGVSIDIGGRLLSFGFYLGCLWPLWLFFRTTKLPQTAFLATGSLLLWSPIYIYWSRTVLIESCALFFCLLWLALLARFLQTATAGSLIGAMLAGLAGILCKVTTFPAVAAVAGLLILADAYRAWSAGTLVTRYRVYAVAATVFIVPLAAETAWDAFSNAIRSHNPFGAVKLTSRTLGPWVYGTWQQRFGPELWGVLWNRSVPEIFGSTATAALAIVGIGLLSRDYVVPILVAALAFMIPFFMFTNLHIVHNFYQYANAIFALAALGIAIAAIAEARQRVLAPLLLAIFVSGQIYFFHRNFAPIISADISNDRVLGISLLARDKTQPTDSLIVIGQDFSSAVAYYSERKSLTIPWWAPATLMQKVFENPQAFLGDSRLGGIVLCSVVPDETIIDSNKRYHGRTPLIDAFVAGRAIVGEVQGCQLLAPGR